MDILKQLFERHFNSPAERVQPLQGQLGGSGRKIVRLANEKASAIGILYDATPGKQSCVCASDVCCPIDYTWDGIAAMRAYGGGKIFHHANRMAMLMARARPSRLSI